MNKSTKRQKAAMLESLAKSFGIVTRASERAGIQRQTHYRWLKDDEDYKKAVEELDNLSLDFAETQLMKNIQEGKETSLIFYLKCKGKKRGYIDKHIVEMESKISMDEGALEFFEGKAIEVKDQPKLIDAEVIEETNLGDELP